MKAARLLLPLLSSPIHGLDFVSTTFHSSRCFSFFFTIERVRAAKGEPKFVQGKRIKWNEERVCELYRETSKKSKEDK